MSGKIMTDELQSYAVAALQAMILKTPLLMSVTDNKTGERKGDPDQHFKEHEAGVVRAAWDYAEAMVAERKARKYYGAK